MIWIAPSEKDALTATLEQRLWDSADQFRANSGLKAQEYSGPILGIIFLRFAEVRFAIQRAKLEKTAASSRRGSRVDEPAAYHAEGILYLAPNARFDFLLNLPEAQNIGAKVNDAMRDIEKHNPQLAGVLPKTYNLFTSTLLKELLKKVSEIPATVDYDAFGRIYEYFLGEFARTEGQKGGEFYTPSCIVRLLTEIIEPYHGRKHGDIVVARTGATTGYAKRLNKLHPDTVFASYLVRARAKAGVSNRMLGIVMESDEYKQYIQTNIGGAAQPQANAVVLTSMRLAVPPSPVSEWFDRLVAPMIDEAELLAVKIQNLRRTRDLLLPRLLSGQISLTTKENYANA